MSKFRKIKEIVLGVLFILVLLLMGAEFGTSIFSNGQKIAIQSELIATIHQQNEINDKLTEFLEWLKN